MRIVVIKFVYTDCSGLYPIGTARLAEVKDRVIGLGETDATHLIAYLRDQASRLSAGAQSGAIAQ